MEEKRDAMFAQFLAQVEDICRHSAQVDDLKFQAQLGNGTSFRFRYNRASFLRSLNPSTPYQPHSVWGGVVDCVGGLCCLLMLIALFRSPWPMALYLLLLATFTFSALDHFLDETMRPAHRVFRTLGNVFRILSLGCGVYAIALKAGSHLTWVAACSLLGMAAALFLLSLQTKGALFASLVISMLLPMAILFTNRSLLGICAASLLSLWSLQELLLPSTWTSRTNTVFGVIGSIVLGLLLLGWGA